MKRLNKMNILTGLIYSFFLSFLLVLVGCSGSGKGGSTGSGSGTTVVSGKVTLSSSIVGLGKPSLRSLAANAALFKDTATGTADSPMIPRDTTITKVLNAPSLATVLANALVDMYDADHPEWLFPIASGSTDSNGDYTLSSMTNASRNTGATYKDGDPIPAGNYTLVAYSGFGLGQKPIVAVQSIVKNFDGAIPNIDFEVLPSDVAPEVIYMFGTKKTGDGTERWGFSDTGVTATVPANAALQLSFSLPMWRDSLKAGISISPSLAGKWSLSADWLTATYYLDPGVQMTPGQVYTITIYGEDSDPNQPRALNVYGNALKTTATGKFTAAAADTIGPTVQWNSPTVIEMGGAVDVTQSFRIESNKPLDVNGVNLRGSPSIGVKPGVLFLGKKNGLYVYEFILGEPLQLATNYNLSVSGGRDLAGHAINTLTGSVTTKDAADTPGIDPTASTEIRNMQAQVKAVFGKWVRSVNDRNIAQWQSVMSGEFYMEYDVATRGIDSTWDLNRDGRYSLGEFSRQLVTWNFPQWEYCGSTITGIITPQVDTYINVNPITNTADFDFKLTAANLVNLSRCFDAAPREMLYMTLKYKNGAWKIVQGSIGIDTRDKTITKPNLINVKLEQDAFPGTSQDYEIIDGGRMSGVPDNVNLTAKFSWEPTTGVNAYVVVIADERNPFSGVAVALPNTVTSLSTDQDPIVDLKGIDLGGKMGFDAYGNFSFQQGGRYYWEVIGLGTATATPDPNNPNDPDFIGNKTSRDILRDISAVSRVRKFGIDNLYSELSVEVRAGSTGTNAPTTYNPAINGYDVGTAFQATISIQTPNADAGLTARIIQSSSAYKIFTVPFNSRAATITMPLYKGVNTFSVSETNVPAGRTPLSKSFWVITQGGKPPIISIWEMTDDLGNTLSGDEWSYYKAPGASKINILGSVSDMAIGSFDVIVSNEFGPYTRTTVTTSMAGDNTYDTATINPPDIEIYQGTNYITLYKYISGPTTTRYRTRLNVWTDTGSVWIPPIIVTGVTATGSALTKTADYSSSSDWNADLGSAANFNVTVAGKFKTIANGRYYASSEGGYKDGILAPDGSGNFSFDVLLYNGWNYISISDSSNNWYGLYIYTTSGKPVIKPEIIRIDGNGYDAQTSGGKYADTDCVSVIEGTSEPGSMWVYWTGTYGAVNYYENQSVSNTNGTFQFAVPLVGGPGSSNIVDINDSNGRRTNVIITTSGSCVYAPATFTVTQVRNAAGGTLSPDTGGNYDAAASATVTISGTSNRPYALVSLESGFCSQYERYKTYAAADGSWTLTGVNLYAPSGSWWNGMNLTMSGVYKYFSVLSANGRSQTLRVQIGSIAGNSGAASRTNTYCGGEDWDAGSSTTITINGTSQWQNGFGYYTDPVNQRKQFEIVNGTFSIPNIPVYGVGGNEVNIDVYDDPAGQSYTRLNISSSNLNIKPQFVTITSPNQGDSGIINVQTVTGSLSDPMGVGFNPSEVNATVYACNNWIYYSTNSYYQTNYGYLPMTFTGSSFSFNVDFCTGQPAYIDVYAYDNYSGQNHYHTITFNGYGSPSRYAKPGASGAPMTDPVYLNGEGRRRSVPGFGK